MQNALVCGVVAALSFIGFITVIYFLLLCLYRPKGNSRYVLKIPPNFKRGEAEALIYGAYFKKLIFGDLIFDEIIIDKSLLSDEEKQLVDKLISENKYYDREAQDGRKS